LESDDGRPKLAHNASTPPPHIEVMFSSFLAF
jgi:hypothetical protein